MCISYGLDRASFNQGQNAKYDFSILEEEQPTLTARGPGGVCTPVSKTMQKTVGAICYDDYKGVNNQYVEQDKLICDEIGGGR